MDFYGPNNRAKNEDGPVTMSENLRYMYILATS